MAAFCPTLPQSHLFSATLINRKGHRESVDCWPSFQHLPSRSLQVAFGIGSAVEQSRASNRPCLRSRRRGLVWQRRHSGDTAPGVVRAAVESRPMATGGPLADDNKASREVEQLPFRKEGYEYWTWRGHKVHYVVQGEGTPIVLVHGFGASAFHWRNNIPALAKKHKVYAICLLGFGWSEKALVDYSAALWRDQLADFLREVVKEPAYVAGNSIGGFTTLSAAAYYPELFKGIALLNVAGRFADSSPPEAAPVVAGSAVEEEVEAATPAVVGGVMDQLWDGAKLMLQRAVLTFGFYQARQPSRIKSVLSSVYPDKTYVDDYLVESIYQPTLDPDSLEVYRRVTTQVMGGPGSDTVDRLLQRLKMPLLLLWGDLDPWMTPNKADRIMQLYPKAERVSLQAGHCPHDEAPVASNEALLKWMDKLEGK